MREGGREAGFVSVGQTSGRVYCENVLTVDVK